MAGTDLPANPYAAPTARLSDPTGPGAVVENGRRVPAANGAGWFRRGWSLFKVAPGAWIVIFLILIVVLVVTSLIPFIGSVINVFLQTMFMGGIMVACRAAEKREPVRINSVFSAFSTHAGPLALLGLLQFAAYVAAIAIIGVLAAIVIGGAGVTGMFKPGPMPPGIGAPLIVLGLLALVVFAMIAIATWLAPALVVLHCVSPVDSIRMSFLGCFKNFGALVVFGIVGLLLAVLASLPVLLGWLVFAPVLLCATYAAYRDLFIGPPEELS
jgi:uncharacterized membrane protein